MDFDRFFLIFLISAAALSSIYTDLTAQDKTFNYGVDLSAMAGDDEFLPFWLYSNQRGTVDPNSPGSIATLNFRKNIMSGESGFDYGFGVNFVSRISDDNAFFFNEAYGRIAYKAFELSGGRFFEQTGTTDESLSMGSLAISSNATPMPKIKFGIPEYAPLPFTDGFIEVKGAIAHGWFEEDRVVEKAWLHEKYAYLRLGGDWAIRPYGGLIHESTWAGETDTEGDLGDSFADFFNVFFALTGSEDAAEPDQIYRQGDSRGIWDFGFYLTLANTDIKVYRQFIFNDKDGLKLQVPQDGLLGLSFDFPTEHQQAVTGFLYEYLYTKNQSGADCPRNQRDGPGGCDNYYNNSFYRSGWTYEGNTLGNPLFLPVGAPGIEGTAFPAGIANNRIVAHHLGIEGKISSSLDYKLLATWSRNSGQYDNIDDNQNPGPTDFEDNPEQWSLFAQFQYMPFRSLALHASLAGDFGELYEDRLGLMLGIKLFGNSSF